MLGFLLASLGVLGGWGKITVRQFELSAAADIRSQLTGENVFVDVKTLLSGIIDGPQGDVRRGTITARHFSTPGLPLYTEPWRSQRGILRHLRLELDDFYLGNLRIESLRADIPDCRYDYQLALRNRIIRLSRSGVGTGRVVLRAEDLEAFILKKFREIKSAKVTLDKGKVTVEGDGEFVLLKTRFLVIAKLASPDGYTLQLEHARIFFDDRPADELSGQALLKALNPVVDLRADLKLYDAIQIEGVDIASGKLETWGKTRIPTLPGAKKP